MRVEGKEERKETQALGKRRVRKRSRERPWLTGWWSKGLGFRV